VPPLLNRLAHLGGDIGARTTYGQPASRRVNAGFVNVYYDVKQAGEKLIRRCT